MIVGLDFDNTIVRYDSAFHVVAMERELIDQSVPVSKLAVRDSLRAAGREDEWTEIQGYVYGSRMDLAQAYDDAIRIIREILNRGGECRIISHKTRHPYKGPRYDLHDAASGWIEQFLKDDIGPLIGRDHVSFHETKAEKIAHIGAMKCDVFLDDLPEILNDPHFPAATRPVLFDPEKNHAGETRLTRVSGWPGFFDLLGL